MISNPRVGQRVRFCYRKKVAPFFPFHGKVGEVIIPGHGKPRNHLVLVDGRHVIVPAGNLVPVTVHV